MLWVQFVVVIAVRFSSKAIKLVEHKLKLLAVLTGRRIVQPYRMISRCQPSDALGCSARWWGRQAFVYVCRAPTCRSASGRGTVRLPNRDFYVRVRRNLSNCRATISVQIEPPLFSTGFFIGICAVIGGRNFVRNGHPLISQLRSKRTPFDFQWELGPVFAGTTVLLWERIGLWRGRTKVS